MKHDWVINAISEGESWTAGVVATWRARGLIRTKAVSTAATETNIQLTSECGESRSEPLAALGGECP